MKRARIVIVCMMLITSFIIIAFPVENVKASGNTLFVGGSGPGNYTIIQNAIDDANSGDTVFVYNGTYFENIVVNKTINLIGENKYDTIIDGTLVSEPVVYIIADWVNMSGFDIQGSQDGIRLNYSNYSTILDNKAFGLTYGIGISLVYSNNNNIIDNHASSDQGYGVYLLYSNNNTVTGNNGTGSTEACVSLSGSNYNTITDNIGGFRRGIWLISSSNNTITDNKFINNGYYGIHFNFSNYNTVTGNNISNSQLGNIYLSSSNNNNITDNKFINGFSYGVHLDSSHYNIITGNNISNNLVEGIRINSSINNIIYHNIFNNNGINAYDNLSNIWDNGYPSGGNYWSDYYGNDNYQGPNQDIPGGDDIGDIPYNITGGNNQDLYPFMEQNGWLNKPPNVPNNPNPINNSKNIDIDTELSWTGGDPDCGNTVIYDIYFGTGSDPPKVIDGHWGTVYDPGVLNYNTTYFWKIVSWDNYGASTIGPIWSFTTIKLNHPPNTPFNPNPQNGTISININQDLFWNGSDPDIGDTIAYDVYFGSMLPLQKVASNISTATYNSGILENSLTYYWYIVAWDNHDASTAGPIWHFTTIKAPNRPPNKPNRPIGVTSGKIGHTHSYTSSTTDPDDDYVYYWFDWGDGTNSGWDGPYYSGDNVTLAHFWVSRGDFPIKVKAKDIHGNESVWSDPFIMSIPKTKISNPIIQFIYRLIERFSFMEKILNYMLSIS